MNRGYTIIDQNSVTYEWKINNIDAYLNVTSVNMSRTCCCLSSPEFSIGIKDKFTGQLQIAFDYRPSYNHTVSLSLLLLDFPIYTLTSSMIKYSAYILDKKKEKQMMKNNHQIVTSTELEIFSLSKKALQEKVDEYLPDNILTVGLDLTIYRPSNSSTDTLLCIPSKLPMTEDYKKVYSSKIASDIIINVCGKEFRAHKICLIARSPVLAAMFSHEMIEKKTNKIDIVDLKPTIFEKILEYIYTDEVTNLDAHAEDLLEAADKYQIQSLKNICQESICKTLTQENAFKVSALADLHKADYLLKFTTNFISMNIKNVIKSQEFLDFKKENPVLAFDWLTSFMLSPGEDT
ncbi:speckle-type POZ protein B-like [Cotesia glomerata]|uniref:speckle-type POZ protein B-like n=1 Tax=Cotesia glomerata TaxID=32391 RepID=UPI001D014177|nr:speckle-type POZ protein B-like [Cotesia glomerata]